MTIQYVCLVIAFVCFVASAFGVTTRVNLQSAGLAFWLLSLLIVR